MSNSERQWQGGKPAQCPHPPDQVVMGNDRMEMVCVLCGARMPFDAARDDHANAAQPQGDTSRVRI